MKWFLGLFAALLAFVLIANPVPACPPVVAGANFGFNAASGGCGHANANFFLQQRALGYSASGGCGGGGVNVGANFLPAFDPFVGGFAGGRFGLVGGAVRFARRAAFGIPVRAGFGGARVHFHR